MQEKIIKYMEVKASKQNDRVLRFIGSDEKVDRDGDVVKTDAWDLKFYKKNPVVLFGHNYAGTPVAKTKKVWVDKAKKQLLFDIEFPEKEVSEIGDSLYKLYSNGYMSATSVGFMPDYEKITYPDNKKKGIYRVINGQQLNEISLVSIGANPRALLTSKSMDKAIEEKVIDQKELDVLKSWIKEDTIEEDTTIELTKQVSTLEAKVAELEFIIEDSKMSTETEEDIYSELYKEFVYKEKEIDLDTLLEEAL